MIQVDQEQIHKHLDGLVLQSVEQTLNALLDAEADALCGAGRYERSPDRVDTRAGHYTRQLHTKAGEVTLKVPKLRSLPFETAIIERYRRRETSVEEALVEMYLAMPASPPGASRTSPRLCGVCASAPRPSAS
jgi:transposase-like protein